MGGVVRRGEEWGDGEWCEEGWGKGPSVRVEDKKESD